MPPLVNQRQRERLSSPLDPQLRSVQLGGVSPKVLVGVSPKVLVALRSTRSFCLTASSTLVYERPLLVKQRQRKRLRSLSQGISSSLLRY